MTIQRKYMLIAVAIIGLSAVMIIGVFFYWSERYQTNIAGWPPYKYEGFQTWPTPRDFDGPGTLFTVEEGYLNVVGHVKAKPQIVGNEFLSRIDDSHLWKAGVLQSFLGKFVDLAADTNINISARFEAKGAERWRVIPAEFQEEIREVAERNAPQSLFIISESISVKEIAYTLSKRDVSSFEQSLDGSSSSGVKFTSFAENGDNVMLVQKFEKPMFLFYRTQSVKILRGLQKQEILFIDTSSIPEYKSERKGR